MKTTVDIPDALANEIQRRAIRAGREVKDVIAELLTASISLAATIQSDSGQTVAKTLPLIKARPVQPSGAGKLSAQEWCDWIKGVDLEIR